VHHRGHFFGSKAFRSDQVRPADIAYKKRVAGEKLGEFVTNFGEYRYAFGRVAGRFAEGKFYIADEKFVAVRHLVRRKFRVRALPVDDLGSGAFGEFDVAADKIGVRMRFDNVFYL